MVSEKSFFKILGFANDWVFGNSTDTTIISENDGDYLLTPLKSDCHLPVVSPLTEEIPKTISESPKIKVMECTEKNDDEQ